MTSLLLACSLLSLADGPDLVDEPMRFDIGVPPPCTSNEDCPFSDTPLCNPQTGDCVECLGPEQCEEGFDCSDSGFCRDACEVDADCEGIDGQTLCNPETGFCVQCLGPDDCMPAEYCSESNFCQPDHCMPGQTLCLGATILLCLPDGGSTMEVEVCEEACEANDGMAECVAGSGGSTGGMDGTGGGEGTTGATGSPVGSDGSASTGNGGSGGDTSTEDDPGGEGCSCRSSATPRGGWAWLLVLGAGLARRRRAG